VSLQPLPSWEDEKVELHQQNAVLALEVNRSRRRMQILRKRIRSLRGQRNALVEACRVVIARLRKWTATLAPHGEKMLKQLCFVLDLSARMEADSSTAVAWEATATEREKQENKINRELAEVPVPRYRIPPGIYSHIRRSPDPSKLTTRECSKLLQIPFRLAPIVLETFRVPRSRHRSAWLWDRKSVERLATFIESEEDRREGAHEA